MNRKPDRKSSFSGKKDTESSSAGKKAGRDQLSKVFHALKEDVDRVCTESIPERILDNIRKQLGAEEEKPKRATRRMMTGPWVIRIALLALGAVLFLGMVLSAKRKDPAPKPLRPDRTGAGPSYTEFVSRPAPKSQQYRAQAAFSSSVSPLESGFHGEFFCVFDDLDGFLLSPPVVVSGRSAQIWTARSFNAPDLKEHLTELCGDIQVRGPKITKKGTALVFSAGMNARQAAVLVKQLAAWGLIFVSGNGFLPDRYLYLGPGEAKTELVITFLLKGQNGPGHLTREERNLFLGHGDPAGGGR